MSVWIVTHGDLYEGGQPLAVFSTEQKAVEWRDAELAKQKAEGFGNDTFHSIDEWVVDS